MLHRTITARLLLLTALVTGNAHVLAAPQDVADLPPTQTVTAPNDAYSDAVSRFLRQNGLMSPSTDGVIQQMRDTASDLVLSAMNFLGVPYRRGGVSAESGFDCSGFTRHVFENSVGLLLPRRSRDQAQAPGMLDIRRDDLKPGDLVFFNTMRSAFSHVGIYVGDGKFIHSPRTGSTVRVEDMRESYWTKRYNGARRAPEVSAGSRGLNLNAFAPSSGNGSGDTSTSR